VVKGVSPDFVTFFVGVDSDGIAAGDHACGLTVDGQGRSIIIAPTVNEAFEDRVAGKIGLEGGAILKENAELSLVMSDLRHVKNLDQRRSVTADVATDTGQISGLADHVSVPIANAHHCHLSEKEVLFSHLLRRCRSVVGQPLIE
jgi:hypothetical protein